MIGMMPLMWSLFLCHFLPTDLSGRPVNIQQYKLIRLVRLFRSSAAKATGTRTTGTRTTGTTRPPAGAFLLRLRALLLRRGNRTGDRRRIIRHLLTHRNRRFEKYMLTPNDRRARSGAWDSHLPFNPFSIAPVNR